MGFMESKLLNNVLSGAQSLLQVFYDQYREPAEKFC